MLAKLGRILLKFSDVLSFVMVVISLAAITFYLMQLHKEKKPIGRQPQGSLTVAKVESTEPGAAAPDAAALDAVGSKLARTKTIETETSAGKAGTALLPESWKLVDSDGHSVFPMSVCAAGDDLFFLTPLALYRVPAAQEKLAAGTALTLEKLVPPDLRVSNIPWQELVAFAYLDQKRSLVLLDKSGSLFEYGLDGKWKVLFSNARIFGSPDPHYVDLAGMGTYVCLLDPERNQIWKMPSGKGGARYFKEVLPWRIKKGDPNVADAVAIAHDVTTYVLRRNGVITGYKRLLDGRYAPVSLPSAGSSCPTRLFVGPGTPLYVVDRESTCVIAVDRKTGKRKQFSFPPGADLRGLIASVQGFFIIDADSLKHFFLQSGASPAGAAIMAHHHLPDEFKNLRMPINNAKLPRHPGVFPGARRVYRFGIHQGLDFFNDPGNGTHVSLNTPVLAAAPGKVVRADVDFKDMTDAQYARVEAECRARHFCSEENENKFRGCQVWIDHGNGLITRYAHLNSVSKDLRPGSIVSGGQTIGFVGVSGTGEDPLAATSHPHLHFEILLNGKYLGYGLTASETMCLYRNIFATQKHS